MKKYLFVALAAAALAGCTNDEWVDNGTPQDGEDKVPILMSAGLEASVASTKAVVNGLPSTATEDLFAVNAYLAAGASGSTGGFTDAKVDYDPNAQNEDDKFTFDGGSRFYPVNGDELEFYAYAPVGTTTGNNVTFNITGEEDIMWAKNSEGSNAIGKDDAIAGTQPKFALAHQLQQVKFQVKAGEGTPANTAITKLVIKSVGTTVTLPVKTGAVTFGNEDLTAFSGSQELTSTAADLKTVMFKPCTSFKIVATAGGVEYPETTVTLSGTTTGSKNAGDAGVACTVILTFTGVEIIPTATIANWETVLAPIDVEVGGSNN